MIVLNILSFILAVVAYSIHELYNHGKLKWTPIGFNSSFWGNQSDLRKYKFKDKKLVLAPNSWYYNFFKIKYKERWPTSATLTVLFTDGAHLAQFVFKLFLILTLVTYEPIINMVWDFIIYFLLFGLTFTVTYKLLSK